MTTPSTWINFFIDYTKHVLNIINTCHPYHFKTQPFQLGRVKLGHGEAHVHANLGSKMPLNGSCFHTQYWTQARR